MGGENSTGTNKDLSHANVTIHFIPGGAFCVLALVRCAFNILSMLLSRCYASAWDSSIDERRKHENKGTFNANGLSG